MLTLGWFDAEIRGSNWKFRPAWRARLRMASVNGTSSMTMSGTGSSGLACGASAAAAAPPAGLSAGAALVAPGASTFARSALAVPPGAGTAGVVAGTAGSVDAGGTGVVLSGAGAGGYLSWPTQSSVLAARPRNRAVSCFFMMGVFVLVKDGEFIG